LCLFATGAAAAQEYVVARLIKGAGSGQGAARQGFTTALACALQAHPDIDTPGVVVIIDELLATTGSMKPSVRHLTY
jgi:DNA polymerase phi